MSLSAGTHVLRLTAVQPNYGVEKLRVMPETTPPGDCGTSGLNLCVQFEAAPDTRLGVPDVHHVRSQNLGGTLDWSVQNRGFGACDGDRADDPDRIALVSGGADGTGALKFTTQERDDCVHSSSDLERSEVELSSSDTGGQAGQDQWWSHSVFLPANAPIPLPPNRPEAVPYDGAGFFQFHGNRDDRDQPNFIMDIFYEPGTNRAILRAVTSGDNGSGGEVEQYSYEVNNTHYVRGQCIHSWTNNVVQTGVWYDFVHHVRWGVNHTGLHEIWMRVNNGPAKKVMSHSGINTLYTNDDAYLKLGLYHKYIPGASSVIHDRLRRGTSFEAVSPFARPSETIVPCTGY